MYLKKIIVDNGQFITDKMENFYKNFVRIYFYIISIINLKIKTSFFLYNVFLKDFKDIFQCVQLINQTLHGAYLKLFMGKNKIKLIIYTSYSAKLNNFLQIILFSNVHNSHIFRLRQPLHTELIRAFDQARP